MSQKKDDDSLEERTSARLGIATCCLGGRSRPNVKPTKSLHNVKEPPAGLVSCDAGNCRTDWESSPPSTPHSSRTYSLREESPESPKEKRKFTKSELLVSDCWNAATGETQLNFLKAFKGGAVEEEDDEDLPVKRRRLNLEEDSGKSPPYTKEFHLLTEVQKARILTTVEDTIKKLVHEDHYQGKQEPGEKPAPSLAHQTSVERFFCKKFLLPWVIMKVVEMVLCHVIQLTFLSQDSYFERKSEFLPVVVTYYLTLFIVVLSLVVHISCFSYSGIQNPCYFMGVISSAILTLTTALGVLIMLTSMECYRTFSEILVLVFIGALLCSLFAELCLCYVEVRKICNRVGQTHQYYLN